MDVSTSKLRIFALQRRFERRLGKEIARKKKQDNVECKSLLQIWKTLGSQVMINRQHIWIGSETP